MTKYHNSPNTGKPSRCRAEGACPFGLTHGTVIRKDGTIDVGTGSPSWSNLPTLPDEHNSQERIIVDENGEAKNIWHVENQPGRMAAKKPSTNSESRKVDENIETLDIGNGSTLTFVNGVIHRDDVDPNNYHPNFTALPRGVQDGLEENYHSVESMRNIRMKEGEYYRTIEHTLAMNASAMFALLDEDDARVEAEQLAAIANQQVMKEHCVNPTQEEYEHRKELVQERKALLESGNDEQRRKAIEKETKEWIVWKGVYDRIEADHIMVHWHMEQGTEFSEQLKESIIEDASSQNPYPQQLQLIEDWKKNNQN